LSESVLVVLAGPIGGLENLSLIKVTEGVSVFVRVAIMLGIILASPYVLAQVWIFVGAGLKPNERRMLYLLFPFALLLFLSGVAFAYYVMLPVAVPFLTTFLNIQSKPILEDYVQFVTNAMLWVGISFEMPLILFGLAKLKIVNTGMLARNWRIAVVIVAIVAAVVTPTPDPVNMAIVAAPLLALYGLSIVLTLFA
jgi:sec-independent protein translocase protein TatC